jgi:hypothetical protein
MVRFEGTELQFYRPRASSTKAGVVYALAVFALGFALGMMRLVLVAPRIGATAAVLAETPVILAASWWLSALCSREFSVEPSAAARILMGAVAFIALMCLELGLSMAVFGRSIAQYLVGFRSWPGAVGLVGQVCFAAFPLLQSAHRHSPQ